MILTGTCLSTRPDQLPGFVWGRTGKFGSPREDCTERVRIPVVPPVASTMEGIASGSHGAQWADVGRASTGPDGSGFRTTLMRPCPRGLWEMPRKDSTLGTRLRSDTLVTPRALAIRSWL